MFSSRLPSALAPNAITRAVAAIRAGGMPILDLTETNPTAVGLPYPPGILAPLADAAGERYAPEPMGLASARAAVSREYQRAGVSLTPEQVMLTASTSEAYALLFKLLCDPGDQVLVPQPSYPLFESLTALESVQARPYRLDYHGGWAIDRASFDHALTARARAVLVVSPNNPTGSRLRADDRDWLCDVCAARGLAIIADEVFADYPLRPKPGAVSCAGESRVLTFALGGLSKSAGLPQLKLGWMAVSGPAAPAAHAIERLEVLGDAYLSVSTPVQAAAPALIESGRAVRASIQQRLVTNLACLERLVGRHPAVTLLAPEGGWSAVLRVPATESEESLVLRLLNEARVLVHPGFFFDFADEAFLVVSLLPEPAAFEQAVRRLLPMAGGPAA
jgi:aspartate/methionine/tyrosine aminotransferase